MSRPASARRNTSGAGFLRFASSPAAITSKGAASGGKLAARSRSTFGRLVVVAENHSVIGGLGEAVAGLLMRNGVMPGRGFRQIGLPDEFLDAGALPTLHDRYGISAAAMARSIRAWL